jgi:energy-coupling factor transporter ATP-binding protein EcfA2
MAPREPTDWDVLWYEVGTVFSPGAPIDEQELFAGRANQIRDLISAVFQRGQHAIIFGERGVGKTSLANTFTGFMHDPRSKVVAMRVNCDGTDSFATLWRKALADLDISETLAARPTPDDVRRALREVAAVNTLIVVLDEFDRLKDKSTTTLIADTIKGLSDHSVPATIVLVGVADSVSGLLAEHASVGRALVEIPMPRMTEDELNEVIEKRLSRLGMRIQRVAQGEITSLSQGLPHYTHLLTMNAAQAAVEAKTKVILPAHVDAAISRCIEKAQQSTRDAYYKATTSPRKDNLFQEVLLSCALAETDDLGFFTATSVASPMSGIMKRRYEIPSFAQHLRDFCSEARGPVLERRGTKRRYRYRFCDPLMQPYVMLRGMKAEMITRDIIR